MDELDKIPEPDPLRLIDYLEGRLSAEETRRVEALVAASGLWRAELAMAHSFVETTGEDAPAALRARARRAAMSGTVLPLPSRPQRWLPALLAAASLALIVFGGRELLDRQTSHNIRSAQTHGILVLTVERGADAWVFHWSPPAGAGSWRAVVTDVAGTVLLETSMDAARPRLDFEALSAAGSGPWLVRLLATGEDDVAIRSTLAELP